MVKIPRKPPAPTGVREPKPYRRVSNQATLVVERRARSITAPP